MFMRRASFALLAVIGIFVALFASDVRRPVVAQTATGSTVHMLHLHCSFGFLTGSSLSFCTSFMGVP